MSCPCDGDIEPTLATSLRERTEIEWKRTSLVLAECNREENDVTLVPLDVFKVFHKQSIGCFEGLGYPFIV